MGVTMKRNEEYSNINTKLDSENFHSNTHSKVVLAVGQGTKIQRLIVNRFWPTDCEPAVT
jgi:1,2-phenylacetyl-CoA epoxidase catalytic subunit